MDEKKKKEIQKNGKYMAKLSKKGITIDFLREDIEQNLPHLAQELNNAKPSSKFNLNNYTYEEDEVPKQINEDQESLSIESGDIQIETAKNNIKKNVDSHYSKDSELFYPSTEDFLRRCSNLEEAFQIIDYQLRVNQITESEAISLKKRCETEGIRTFGTKKEWGYYEKTYRNNSSKNQG